MIVLKVTYIGIVHWKKDNIFHNKYKPANAWTSAHYEWYYNGNLHRLDGHARLWEPKPVEYYVNGIFYKEVLEYLVAVSEYRTQHND